MANKHASAEMLRGKLLINGLTISSWAIRNGYRPNFVRTIMSRFISKDKRPKKCLSLEIIEKLEAEIGIKICG